MFYRKLKQRIKSLEAITKGLREENQRLRMKESDSRSQIESLRKELEGLKRKPARDAKGRFVKK